MGPFAMSDLAGLDIGWSRETSKGETVREILCEQDRRGQKTGAGFYDYDEARNAKPSPVVEKIILDFAAKKGINRRSISAAPAPYRAALTCTNCRPRTDSLRR